ncbi:hypothetical protein HY641_03600 [Candidatus Woesearchaeota archaeon]|nr:hypothetical protein [Candidatus Woesearchaeota archaeon]
MRYLYSMFVVLILAISPMAFAQDAKEFRGEALNARSAHLDCAVDLAKAQLDINAKYGQVDVSTQKTQLEDAYKAVTDAAAAGDKKTFDDAAKRLRESLNSARKGMRGKTQPADLRAARDEVKAAKDAFKTCNKEAVGKAADAAKKRRDANVEKWQKRLLDLKAKGVDTAKMQDVLDKAKENLGKLEDAGDDVEKIKQARKDIRTAELHSHANFAIERVRASIAKASEKGLSVDFADAKALLDEAAAMATPGKEYSEGEFQAVWDKIKEASKKAKDALKSARSTAKESSDAPEADAE